MEDGKHTKKTLSGMALRFWVGAGMGALITAVPFSAGYSSQLSIGQVSLAGFLVVGSGALSCLWGDKFLDAVSKGLDSTSVQGALGQLLWVQLQKPVILHPLKSQHQDSADAQRLPYQTIN